MVKLRVALEPGTALSRTINVMGLTLLAWETSGRREKAPNPPAVRSAVDAYVAFARDSRWELAVASSLTEMFAPDLMIRRLASLEKQDAASGGKCRMPSWAPAGIPSWVPESR